MACRIFVMAFHFVPWSRSLRPARIDRRPPVLRPQRLPDHAHPAASRGQLADRVSAEGLLRAPGLADLPALLPGARARGASSTSARSAQTIGWHVTYLTNVYFFDRGSWHGSISHLWSLAVEEQFYWCGRCVMLTLPERRLPAVIAAMIIAAPMSRLLVGGPMNSVLPTSCLDSLGARRVAGAAGDAKRDDARWLRRRAACCSPSRSALRYAGLPVCRLRGCARPRRVADLGVDRRQGRAGLSAVSTGCVLSAPTGRRTSARSVTACTCFTASCRTCSAATSRDLSTCRGHCVPCC